MIPMVCDVSMNNYSSSSISIAIAFDVTQSHIQPAFVTIYSVFRCFLPINHRLSVWIFVSELNVSVTVARQLACIRQMQTSVQVSIVNFDQTIARELYPALHASRRDLRIIPVVLFRLYYTELLSSDFIISMDTDMYAGRHFLPELLDIIARDVNKALIYAVHDQWAQKYYRQKLGLNMSLYVNAGFFVIRNNEEGKALMRLARAQLVKWGSAAWLLDQDVINLALQEHPSTLYLLPGCFNCFRGWCFDRHLEGQAIHHQKSGANLGLLRTEYVRKCLQRH
jgi:lipopolysaccharide biosynthesis glycosyltransferase